MKKMIFTVIAIASVASHRGYPSGYRLRDDSADLGGCSRILSICALLALPIGIANLEGPAARAELSFAHVGTSHGNGGEQD